MSERKTAPFRAQHERLLEIAGEISEYLADGLELLENSNTVSKLLADLSRELKMHLTIEDTSLYPILCLGDNEELKNKALEFKEEMGGIRGSFEAYIAKWPSGYQIKENFEEFIKETKSLFEALAERIDRENNILYQMIDELFS
jgi:iron-sulfur cluster repair protein YtfE (RIC family)